MSLGTLEDHQVYIGDGPLAQKFLGRQVGLVGGGQGLVEGVEVVVEHLAGGPVRGLLLEIEHVGDPVEDKGITDHWPASSTTCPTGAGGMSMRLRDWSSETKAPT